MNPIEARRRILADPRAASDELREALGRDPKLAEYRASLLALDEEVRLALADRPVPDGLADRLILHARDRQRPWWPKALAAAAAALALAAALMLPIERTAVAATMMDHVVAQEREWQDTTGVDAAVLRQAVAQLGVTVRDGPWRVRHLGPCLIAGREARHFTIDGPRGTVTFVVYPAQDADDGPVLLVKGTTHGYFMKRADATVGVFTRSGESPEELARLLHEVIS